MGLESELTRMRGWVESLKSEAEDKLKSLGTRLGLDVQRGDAAIEDRRKATGATADHRAREIMRLIDDANAARMALYGELVRRMSTLEKDRSWPENFFVHGQSRAKTSPVGSSAPAAPGGGRDRAAERRNLTPVPLFPRKKTRQRGGAWAGNAGTTARPPS